MSSLGKFALALVIPVVGAVAGAGASHAAGDLYGAIATSPATGGVGEAFDYPTQDAANEAALDACRNTLEGKPYGSCTVIMGIHNECGSVAETDYQFWLAGGSIMPMYSFGRGANAQAAEQAVRYEASFYRDQLFSVVVKPSFVVDTICTANAG